MSQHNTYSQSILIYAEKTCPPLKYDIQYVNKQINNHTHLYIVPHGLTLEQLHINENIWSKELPRSQYTYLANIKPQMSLSKLYTSVVQKLFISKYQNTSDRLYFVIPFHSSFQWKEHLRKSIRKYTDKKISFIERNYRSKQVHDKWSLLVKRYYQHQNPKYKNRLMYYIPESIGLEVFDSILAMLFAIM
jgi:hypothetical protein